MAIFDVTDFQSQVLDRSRSIPVLVDFWAAWCGPCRTLGPVLERIAEKHDGEWDLAKVDTEALPDVSARYGIRSIPSVKLFVDGEPVKEFTGALPESAVEQWLNTALPDRHGDTLALAEARAQALDFAGAAELLEQVLAAQPGHEIARVRLAAAVLCTQRERALELAGDLLPAGPDGERAEAVRALAHTIRIATNGAGLPDTAAAQRYHDAVLALAAQQFDAALDGFIEVLRSDRSVDDDGARKACIGIFKLLGEEHEVTLRHRRAFDRAF